MFYRPLLCIRLFWYWLNIQQVHFSQTIEILILLKFILGSKWVCNGLWWCHVYISHCRSSAMPAAFGIYPLNAEACRRHSALELCIQNSTNPLKMTQILVRFCKNLHYPLSLPNFENLMAIFNFPRVAQVG